MRGANTKRDIGTAGVSEYDEDGFLGVQCDSYGDDGGCPLIEVHAPYGFQSRPLDPDANGRGCHLITEREGSRQHAWFSQDPRVTPNLPKVKKGGSMQHATRSFAIFDGDDGSFSVYVPYAFEGGTATKAHLFELGVASGAVQIKQAGGATITMEDDKIVLYAPNGASYIEIKNDGITLNGNVKITGMVDIGGGTLSPPNPPKQSSFALILDPVTGAPTPCTMLKTA